MKFFVIVAVSIGGAEKRFFDIFRGLACEHSDVRLILSAKLYKLLSHLVHDDLRNKIIVIGDEKDELKTYCVKYYWWLLRCSPKNASFHYPTNCLFLFHLFFLKHRLTSSLTNCYVAPALFTKSRSRIRQYFSFLFVDAVDVLNPSIYDTVKKYRVLRYKPVRLTPNGTYVFPDVSGKDGFVSRTSKVGYVGRLIKGKGVDEFLDIVPSLWDLISERVPSDFVFFVAGHGPLSSEVEAKVLELSNLGIPIVFMGFVNADEIFSSASIVLSTQKITNFPSRVVAEARLNGCSVLVRDTGDSRQFGLPVVGMDYFSADFNLIELSDKIISILNDYADRDGYDDLIRLEAKKVFSSNDVLNYFYNIFSGWK